MLARSVVEGWLAGDKGGESVGAEELGDEHKGSKGLCASSIRAAVPSMVPTPWPDVVELPKVASFSGCDLRRLLPM